MKQLIKLTGWKFWKGNQRRRKRSLFVFLTMMFFSNTANSETEIFKKHSISSKQSINPKTTNPSTTGTTSSTSESTSGSTTESTATPISAEPTPAVKPAEPITAQPITAQPTTAESKTTAQSPTDTSTFFNSNQQFSPTSFYSNNLQAPSPHQVFPPQQDWTVVEDGVFESAEYWAIKLKFDDQSGSIIINDSELDQLADQVAQEHNLENQGRIGELRGHYLFKKLTGDDDESGYSDKNLNNDDYVDNFAESFRKNEDTTFGRDETNERVFGTEDSDENIVNLDDSGTATVSGKQQAQVQYNYYPPSQDNRKSSKQIGIKLKLHPHVDWHMPQILLKRKRRAVIQYNFPNDLDTPEEIYDYKFDESKFEESNRNGISEFYEDYLDGTAVDPNNDRPTESDEDFDELTFDENEDAENDYDEKIRFSVNDDDDSKKFSTYHKMNDLVDLLDFMDLSKISKMVEPKEEKKQYKTYGNSYATPNSNLPKLVPVPNQPSFGEHLNLPLLFDPNNHVYVADGLVHNQDIEPARSMSNRVDIPEEPIRNKFESEENFGNTESTSRDSDSTNPDYGNYNYDLLLGEGSDSYQPPVDEVEKYLIDNIKDPEFRHQWHLKNYLRPGMDTNVTGCWMMNVNGSGVTVAIVDDGVQWTHPDLIANYNPEGSLDLNDHDNNPMPQLDSREENKHGTRCAGEIAAVPNDICGVGVAPGARFSGIRILDGPITDSMEATAFMGKLAVNDIYSCSWGPEDDGKTLDGPHPLAQAALIHGVTSGRRGFGTIYVVASGNGGAEGDNCNFDGYANSIYTITIGAVDERGEMPYYAEECAAMLASTFSSGAAPARKVVTTDWTMGHDNAGCTSSHTGTSAATPLAAGMLALALQVRPCLTWRDVQHLIVYTATKPNNHNQKISKSGEWVTNAAGFHHSTKFGFGVLNAWRLVTAAQLWQTVPDLTSFSPLSIGFNEAIPMGAAYLRLPATVLEGEAAQRGLRTLEHVQITVNIDHTRRGDIEISLICPSGTPSLLANSRYKDDSVVGFRDWTFSTARCWAEPAKGTFYLIVRDRGNVGGGVLRYWRLNIYGNSWSSEDIEEQKRTIEESYSGEYLENSSLAENVTGPCPAGNPYRSFPIPGISERTLKLLALMSALFVFWSVYYSIEMAFCSSNEENFSLENVEISQQGVDILKLALNQVSDDEIASTLIAVRGDEDLIQALRDAAPKIELSQENELIGGGRKGGDKHGVGCTEHHKHVDIRSGGNRRHRKSHNSDVSYGVGYNDNLVGSNLQSHGSLNHSTEIKYSSRTVRPSYKSTKKH